MKLKKKYTKINRRDFATGTVILLVSLLLITSCKKYLNILPTGAKIPTTLADFEALLRDEYGNQRTDITQAILLLNDRFETSSNLNYYPLYKANYMWDESADRISMNNSDEATYYNSYTAISTCNLIIQHAPTATDATESDRKTVTAQAKIIRALNYYVLANFYAETYTASTASSTLSVPLITSAEVNAPYKQVTIQEIYDFILADIHSAIPDLPAKSATIIHPNIGAAWALAARVYLQMEQYDQALDAADKALAQNNELYDWTAYYETYKAQINTPDSYVRSPSPMGYDYKENYYFRHGSRNSTGAESNLRIDRTSRFETGDARFASRWKLRTVGSDTYYYGMTSGFYNYGGLTTTEVYLIKAECLARKGDLPGAMDNLNKVRVKRILPANYAPLSATTTEQAVNYIRRTKENELIFSIVPFADARRLNKDPKYARTLTKTENGANYSLGPNSHLWVMPFPFGAIKNPGNGSLKQNTDK